nr:LOW QUALITY PROTEIN: serine-rich adhesin for platelets-like [Danaus plexippus plexippus]
MKLNIRRSCLSFVVLSALIKTIQSNENETDKNETRRGRVSGRIVKLYSGYKPDPIMCHNEGFQADPMDCSVFYRCVQSSRGKFNVFRFQCGPGTVYDPETEICNHASNTKRSECGAAISSNNLEINENGLDMQELPSPITTSPLNIQMNGSVTSISISEKDLHILNSTTASLTTTAAVNQQFSEAFDISGMYPWDNKNSDFTPNPILSKPALIEKNNPCTFDGFVGDSYDCKKFYRCVNNFRGGFTRYEFVCSDSTIWDDDKQSCNYAWAVRSRRCGRDATRNNVLNAMTTHYENENNLVDKDPNLNHFGEKIQNSYISNDSPTSINQNKDHTRITSSSFSMVTIPYDNANIVTDKNEDPAHFIDKQNNSSLSGTSDSQNQEIKIEFTMSSNPSSSTEHTLLSSSVNDSWKLLNNVCTQSGFIGDPNDCKKFYRCVDNGQGSYTKYEFSCSQGTLWDSEIEACNHAWAVKGCGNTAFTQSLTTETSVSNVVSSEINPLPDGINNVDDDFGYPNLVDQDHMKTTTSKIETTFSLPATNEEANILDKSCSTSGYFVNSLDCSKFYRCVENGKGSFTRFDYNCGEGTVWDESIEACNHAWAVKSCRSNSENFIDSEQMTTITLVQTSTQKNKDNNDYDSIYGSQQSTMGSNIVTELSTTTLKQTLLSQNECTTNGFIGDSRDCKKFYRCVENGDGGYTKYEFSCGDETVWDPVIEACNHNSGDKDCTRSSNNNYNTVEPINSNEDVGNHYVTSSSQDPENPAQSQSTTSVVPSNNNLCETAGFMGDSNDCEKFYRCVENGKGGYNRIEFKCAEGTVWDSSIEACNHRWAVENCGKDSANEFIETTIDSMSTVTDKTSISTKSPEYSETLAQYTSTERTNVSEDSCSSEGFFGSVNGECNKFYRCVDNGRGGYYKYEFTCGDGTVWDENIKACNHDTYNKTCRISDSKPQTDTTISTDGPKSTTHASITNVQEPSKPDDKECKSEGFIPNPLDCHKFFRCVDNGEGGYTKFEFSCGEGTVWIQEIQACDHDTGENSCNQQNNNNNVITSSSPQVEITTSSVVTESSSSTQSSVEDDSNHKKDNEECTNEGFYPNKNDCQRFYRCVQNDSGGFTKYEFTCAEGTGWDTRIQSCNYIDQVSSCKNVNISETETKANSTVDTVSETQGNTTSTTMQPTTSTTVYPSTSTHFPDETICTEQGFFGDKEDCKKFYRCVSNENEGFVKYNFTCSDGTIWDQDISACNHPEDVSNPSCKLNGTSTTISSTSLPTTSQPSVSSSTPMDSSTTIKDPNSNCSQSNSDHENNKNYTCTKAGFYADPNDCKKFYRCVDWENNGEKFSIYHFECGDGTIWDPALETCNHEDSVYPPRNCNGKEQQNQTSSVSPSTTEVSTTTSSETESTGIVTESETTSSTTSQTTVQSSTTTFSTAESTSTTTQMTTTQPSTTPSKQTTAQTSTTETSTVIMSTSTEPPTKPSSTTIASTTIESSTQQTSTTNSEEPTTDSSTQTTTDMTEITTSVSTTTIMDESTTMSTQTSSTMSQASTTAITTTTEEISSSTTESQSTAMESTTVTNGQDNSTESNKDCPDTEKDQNLYVCPSSFKRHPKYCNLFYQCTEDNDNHEVKIAVFNCPNNTIYDENKVQCVEEKQASKKCNGQISQRNRIKRLGAYFNEPVIVSKNSLRCSEAGHFPFEKREQCSSAFLKCEYATSGQLRGYVYKCPEGFVYWSISRRCEAIRKVRDCKLSSYNWNNRYDVPVERNNIAY